MSTCLECPCFDVLLEAPSPSFFGLLAFPSTVRVRLKEMMLPARWVRVPRPRWGSIKLGGSRLPQVFHTPDDSNFGLTGGTEMPAWSKLELPPGTDDNHHKQAAMESHINNPTPPALPVESSSTDNIYNTKPNGYYATVLSGDHPVLPVLADVLGTVSLLVSNLDFDMTAKTIPTDKLLQGGSSGDNEMIYITAGAFTALFDSNFAPAHVTSFGNLHAVFKVGSKVSQEGY